MKIRSGFKVGKLLGDWVAQVCQAAGVTESAHKYEQVTGKTCGCEKRQEILNRLTSPKV